MWGDAIIYTVVLFAMMWLAYRFGRGTERERVIEMIDAGMRSYEIRDRLTGETDDDLDLEEQL